MRVVAADGSTTIVTTTVTDATGAWTTQRSTTLAPGTYVAEAAKKVLRKNKKHRHSQNELMETKEMEITCSDPNAPEARALVKAMEQEIDELYADRSGSIHSVGAPPGEMSPPNGAFVILRSEGRAVGGGGLKRLDAQACEIKRMYVAPEVRGRGASRDLLIALEDRARDIGYSIARLDTGDRQPAAKRLYENAGYEQIPSYNANNLATYWYEKELGGSDGIAPANADLPAASG